MSKKIFDSYSPIYSPHPAKFTYFNQSSMFVQVLTAEENNRY